MLTLSSDVICDVIYRLHHISVISAMSKYSKFTFGQVEQRRVCKLWFPLTYQYKNLF